MNIDHFDFDFDSLSLAEREEYHSFLQEQADLAREEMEDRMAIQMEIAQERHEIIAIASFLAGRYPTSSSLCAAVAADWEEKTGNAISPEKVAEYIYEQ